MVIRGVGRLLADVDLAAIDRGNCRSVDQAVDEWSVGILKNLLDGTGELVGRLRPVMIFHGDNKNLLDVAIVIVFIFCAGVRLSKQGQYDKQSQHAVTSAV